MKVDAAHHHLRIMTKANLYELSRGKTLTVTPGAGSRLAIVVFGEYSIVVHVKYAIHSVCQRRQLQWNLADTLQVAQRLNNLVDSLWILNHLQTVLC